MLPLRILSLHSWNVCRIPTTLSLGPTIRRHIYPRLLLRREYPPADLPLRGVYMSYWLLKTEPDEWGWAHQSAAGGISHWDGVRNASAQKNMKGMRIGDLCFFYHTGKERAVVGIVRVVKEWYPEPQNSRPEVRQQVQEDSNNSNTENDSKTSGEGVSGPKSKRKLSGPKAGAKTEAVSTNKVFDEKIEPSFALKWGQVDLQEVSLLSRPVSLQEIKAEAEQGAIVDFVLLRHQRLSVVPVSEHNWIRICHLGGQESPPLVEKKIEIEIQEQVGSKGEHKKGENLVSRGEKEGMSVGRRSRKEGVEMRDILKSEISSIGSSIEKPKRKRACRTR